MTYRHLGKGGKRGQIPTLSSQGTCYTSRAGCWARLSGALLMSQRVLLLSGCCSPCHLFPPADPLPTQAGRSRLPTQKRVEEVLTQRQLLFQLSPSPSQSDVAFIHSLGNSRPTLYSSPPICHFQ